MDQLWAKNGICQERMRISFFLLGVLVLYASFSSNVGDLGAVWRITSGIIPNWWYTNHPIKDKAPQSETEQNGSWIHSHGFRLWPIRDSNLLPFASKYRICCSGVVVVPAGWFLVHSFMVHWLTWAGCTSAYLNDVSDQSTADVIQVETIQDFKL